MDHLWYSEYHTPNVKLSIKVNSQLHHEVTEFQTLSVFDSEEFGRFFTLDGLMMMTERDEFIYHEMITHPALAVNPHIRKVLVIGAGDGGVARELAKYAGIEAIHIVEIDRRVVEVAKEFLPQTACGFSDPRVQVYYQDGIKFVRNKENTYDLIIVDSTDPFGPGEVLFTKEFYGHCFAALTEQGILLNQNESPYYTQDAQEMLMAHKSISQVFPVSTVYQAHIPTYPSGHWLFGFASKGLHPLEGLQAENWNKLGVTTKYYNTDLHKGAFYLPNYVRDLLRHG